jgi:hypothetical protein
MSDFSSRHEPNDELLSAYLDDELSPEERAAVKARLADDAAGREMLHQLRAVSQAVQSLPQEIVGHDLGGAVLRRVTQSGPPIARLASTATEADGSLTGRSAEFDDSFPKLTIGRSRRSWFWASLAIAAALLVMAFQPDREGLEQPQAVALREEQVVREEVGRGRAARDELELRTLDDGLAISAPSDGALTVAGPIAPTDTERTIERAASETAPALEPAAQPSDERAIDPGTVAATAPPASRGGGRKQPDADVDTSRHATLPSEIPAQAGAAGAATDTLATSPAGAVDQLTEDLADAPALQEQPVVVRVLARREAVQNKSFDRLLEQNGIAVDAEAAESASLSTVRARSTLELADERTAEDLRKSTLPQPPANDSEEEVVLVEAPASAITSSLETLKADEVNYLGIAVDDNAAKEISNRFGARAGAHYSTSNQDAFAKKLQVQSDWQKYNRGVVPQTEYSLSRDKYYFYERVDDGIDRYGTARGFAGGYGGANPAETEKLQELAQQRMPTERKILGEQSLGRARRLRTWGVEAEPQPEQLARRRYAVPQQPPAAGVQPVEPAQETTTLAGEAADRVQVLFVISPADVPASSPPSRNKAQ